MNTELRKEKLILGYLIFLFAFALYMKTIVPEVYTADCGEMTATSYVLGIPHPTGYPVYCQLNRFFSIMLPVGNIAFRCALATVIFSSLAVVLFYYFLTIFFSLPSSTFVSALLATSFTFWSQANIQEVYGLHFFFLSLTLYFAAKTGKNYNLRNFLLLAFAYGLAVTHHLLTVFAFPALALLIYSPSFKSKIKASHLSGAIGIFVLACSNHLYFPLRSQSNCAIRWMECHNWQSWKYHVTGQQFRNMMFDINAQILYQNILNYLSKLTHQFTWILLLLCFAGFLYLFVKSRKLWFVSVIWFLSVATFFLTYQIIDIEVYYVQSYISILVFLAAGIDLLFRLVNFTRYKTIRAIFAVLLMSFIWVMIVRSFWFNDRTKSWLAYDWGINVYNSAETGSLLVTQGWSSPFVFFYLDHVMGYRRDIKMAVDYKGTLFYNCIADNWETHVASTVPMEIPGINNTRFTVEGLLYKFGDSSDLELFAQSLWLMMRTRSLNDPEIFLDFHSTGLKAKYIMMKAERALQTGRIQEGFRLLKISENIGSSNPLILNNLSGVFFKQGRYEEAIRLARASIKLDPLFYPAYHNLGNALFKTDDFDGALKAFQEVDDYNHALGRQREALGYLFLQKNNCKQATMEFQRAIDVSPYSISARLGLGIAKLHCGQLVGALELFTKVIKLDPTNIDALLNRAIVYIRLGEFDTGIKDLELLLTEQPEHLAARINLSIALSEQGKLERSQKILEELHREHPDNVTILNNLALVYSLEKKMLLAMEMWETSLDNNPGQEHVRRNLRQLRIDNILFKEMNKSPLDH